MHRQKTTPQKSHFALCLLALVAIGQNLGVQHYNEIFRAETRAIANKIKVGLRRVQPYSYSVALVAVQQSPQ